MSLNYLFGIYTNAYRNDLRYIREDDIEDVEYEDLSENQDYEND